MKHNTSQIIFFGALLCLLGSTSAFAAKCSADHCGTVDKELNELCKLDENAGKDVYYKDPDTSRYCSCPCSCFASGETVSSEGQPVSVRNIYRGSLIDSPAGEVEVEKLMRSYVEEAPATRIHLESGNSLLLSNNHPLIDSYGRIVAAGQISPGMKLKGRGYRVDPVSSVENVKYTGWFYNFILDADRADGKDRIIYAKGVQNGDWEVQSYRDYLERNITLRDVIGKIKK